MPSLPFRILGIDKRTNNNNNNNNSNGNAARSSSTVSSSNSRFLYPGHRGSGNTTAASSSSASTTTNNNNANHQPLSLPGPPPRTGNTNALDSSVLTTNSAPPSYNTPSAPPGPPGTIANNNNNLNPITNNIPQQQQQRQPIDPSSAASTTSSGSSESRANRPGAYQVTRTTSGPAQVYRVTVPAGVTPGSEFTVHAGPRRVRVRCPETSQPGQSLQITLPPETVSNFLPLRSAPLTDPVGNGGGGAVAMSKDVLRVNEQARESGGSAQTYLVTIPPNTFPGMQFTVNVAGQRFMVSCPEGAGPGMRVRIVPPVHRDIPDAVPKNQVFEVAVPPGVSGGQPFALIANGQRVLVTCPPDVVPGQKIRFQLPVSQVVQNISLAYESEKGGWKRTIRVTDMKFQWVRIESTGDDKTGDLVDLDTDKFDFMKSAYVRKINFLEGNDARMRTGSIELVNASEAVVDSRIIFRNQTLLSYADIAQIQGRPLFEKKAWFENVCQQLSIPWDDGHIRICVRRSQLLLDSVDAIMGLGRDDLNKVWRIEFLGEPAIDAGGPTREWFELVTEQVFDPACGLWIPSANNQACVDINPASGTVCPEDHLIYFRFIGRVIGRALFNGQLIKGHMVRMIYKHILGWPITFEDVKAQDEEYYSSLKKLTKCEDLSLMCLDFTVSEETMGLRVERELVENGAMKEVTNENLNEYLEANIRYRMFNRTLPQLTELLLGFFDVIPEPPLTIFDANELELVLCGLPEINMEDWQENTMYRGLFEVEGRSNQVVKWFWEVVSEEFDQEMRARLLQFSTGTSGVPLRGFAYLQGIDGNIKKFTIQGVDTSMYLYPKSHTCFNRIDLPNYASKKDLLEKLTVAITTSFVGFDTE